MSGSLAGTRTRDIWPRLGYQESDSFKRIPLLWTNLAYLGKLLFTLFVFLRTSDQNKDRVGAELQNRLNHDPHDVSDTEFSKPETKVISSCFFFLIDLLYYHIFFWKSILNCDKEKPGQTHRRTDRARPGLKHSMILWLNKKGSVWPLDQINKKFQKTCIQCRLAWLSWMVWCHAPQSWQ